MDKPIFYLPLATPVMRQVRYTLAGFGVTISDTPTPEVTHVILGVPSLESDGSLRNGGSLPAILDALSRDVTVIGGNLDHPSLTGYNRVDLLKNESYLWHNAAITADCAISLARPRLQRCWHDTAVLILGFGRIGFHLAVMLRSLRAQVTVAARKESALAQAESMGLCAVSLDNAYAGQYPVIFNTIPHMVLPGERCGGCFPGCVKMDLASAPGIGGSGVLWARGLPGKYAPESSGRLIAKTILSMIGR